MKNIKIKNYSKEDYSKFKEITKIDYNFNGNADNSDYSWLIKFEEYIPNLDAIIRNPRRFIQPDESLVPIEKAKKISEESIKHLAQNTGLIQSLDDDGMPQPLKILNIYKEETYDLYENRFIASLVNNLYMFISQEYDKMQLVDIKNSGTESSIKFNAETKLNKKIYTTSLNITLKKDGKKQDLKAVKNKIDELYRIVLNFKSSQLMKELERAEPVHSPIRKTNAILKDPQLNKCLELWELLEQLQNSIKFDTQLINFELDKNEFLQDLSLVNYINYCTLTNRRVKDKEEDEESKNILYELIKNYVERPEYGIKNFKKQIMEDMNELCLQYEKDYLKVKRTYDNFFNSFTKFN